MNTKTTKFLAVVAVLAMAFAVFAVIAPSEDNDATAAWNGSAITGTVGTDFYAGVASVTESNKAYYYANDASVQVASNLTGLVFLVEEGKTLTISATGTGSYTPSMIALVAVSDITVSGTTVTMTKSAVTTLTESPAFSAWGTAKKGGETQIAINELTDSCKVKSSSTGFNFESGPYSIDVYSSATLKGAFTAVNVMGDSLTLTLNGFTGPVFKSDKTTKIADFEDFTGTAVLDNGAWTITAGSNDGKTVTSGSIVIDNKRFTFYDFAGQIVTIKQATVNLTAYIPVQTNVTSSGEKVALKSAVSGRVAITNVTLESTTVDDATQYIAPSAAMTIAKKATVDIGEQVVFYIPDANKVTNEGKLRVTGTVTVKTLGTNLINNGTVFLMKDGALVPHVIKGTGSVNTDAILAEGNLANEYKGGTTNYQPTVFPMTQKLTATSDIVLKNNAVVIVQGVLEISAGVTITIEKDSQLIINGCTAKLINNGTIINESAAKNGFGGEHGYRVATIDGTFIGSQTGTAEQVCGGLMVGEAYFENNGTYNDDYSPAANEPKMADYFEGGYQTTNISGNAVNEGTIIVGDNSAFWPGYGNFYNNSTMTIYGLLYIDGNTNSTDWTVSNKSNFENAGTITFYGYFGGQYAKIYMMSTSAEIVINELKAMGPWEQTYDTLTVSDKQYKDKYGGTESTVAITLVPCTTTTVTTSAESISGLKIGITANKHVNTGQETGTTYETAMVVSGVLSASVPSTATDWAADVALGGAAVTSDSMTITDNVKVTVNAAAEYTISGTVIATEQGTYSGLFFNSGVSSTAKMTVTGKLTVCKTDITANTANINAAKYEIQRTETTPKQYIYTTFATAVEDGAKSITLYGENKTTTNITIPEGMTVTNKGTLTISKGTIEVAEKARLNNDNSIVVKGTLIANDYKSTFKGEGTVDADVMTINGNVLKYTTLENALATASAGETVTVTRGGDITMNNDLVIPAGVTLEIPENKLIMAQDTVLTINGILDLASSAGLVLNEKEATGDHVDAKAVLNGYMIKEDGFPSTGYKQKIAGAYYEMTIKSIIYGFATPVSNVPNVIDDADDGLFTVYGDTALTSITFDATEAATITFMNGLTASEITIDETKLVFAEGVAISASVTDSLGTVAIKGTAGAGLYVADASDKLTVGGAFVSGSKGSFKIAGTVNASDFTADSAVVDGTMVVAKNNAAAIKKLTVNGTVSIPAGKTLRVTDAIVFGSVVAAEKTETAGAGTLVVENLWVGLKKITTGAAASVSGKVTLGTAAYVLDGATVPAEILELPSTAYYIDGKLWMTAYLAGNAAKITSAGNGPITNGDFNNWMNGRTVITNEVIGEVAKVDADVTYNIYSVTIRSDAGIKEISLNGKLMISPTAGANLFRLAQLEAGTYKVTYTLINGYEGTAQLYTADGTILKDNSFVLSGTDADDRNIVLQLIGTEQIVTPEPSPVEQNEWTITTILLVILVILIAVMAVIVALRLNRS